LHIVAAILVVVIVAVKVAAVVVVVVATAVNCGKVFYILAECIIIISRNT